MADIFLPRRARQQPRQTPAIDWSNPICRGMRFVWLASSPLLNFAQPGADVRVGQLVYGVDVGGVVASNFSDPTISNRLIVEPKVVGFAGPCTFIGGGRVSGDGAFMSIGKSGEGVRIGVKSGNASVTYLGVADYQTTIATSGPAVIGFSINGTNCRAVVRQSSGMSAQTLTVGAPAATAEPLRVGCFGNGDTWPGSLGFAFYFSRSLSDAELRSLVDNPWQVFRAPSVMLAVSSSGGIGGSLVETAAAGESIGALLVCAVSVAEAVAAMEAAICAAAVGLEQVEVASGADSASAAAIGSASLDEVLSALESSTATGPSIAASLVEVASAVDVAGLAATIQGVCAEVVVASETMAGLIQATASQLESGGAVDIISAIGDGDVTFTRAPTGSGYQPQKSISQNRPATGPQSRPRAQQRNNR